MPTDFEELKRKLLQSDEEYRQLATKHHDLDEKLHTYADPQLPHRTRASRRSHPQKTKAAPERPDGKILRRHGTGPDAGRPRAVDDSVDKIQGQARSAMRAPHWPFHFSGRIDFERP